MLDSDYLSDLSTKVFPQLPLPQIFSTLSPNWDEVALGNAVATSGGPASAAENMRPCRTAMTGDESKTTPVLVDLIDIPVISLHFPASSRIPMNDIP